MSLSSGDKVNAHRILLDVLFLREYCGTNDSCGLTE